MLPTRRVQGTMEASPTTRIPGTRRTGRACHRRVVWKVRVAALPAARPESGVIQPALGDRLVDVDPTQPVEHIRAACHLRRLRPSAAICAVARAAADKGPQCLPLTLVYDLVDSPQ